MSSMQEQAPPKRLTPSLPAAAVAAPDDHATAPPCKNNAAGADKARQHLLQGPSAAGAAPTLAGSTRPSKFNAHTRRSSVPQTVRRHGMRGRWSVGPGASSSTAEPRRTANTAAISCCAIQPRPSTTPQLSARASTALADRHALFCCRPGHSHPATRPYLTAPFPCVQPQRRPTALRAAWPARAVPTRAHSLPQRRFVAHACVDAHMHAC